MRSLKKLKLLSAIKNNMPYSRNNKDLAYLEANGYIEVENKKGTSYKMADIKLSKWGESILRLERTNG